jgi:hypothetical protein
MPYHVEVRASRRHARLFNLDAEELQRRIVGPWQLGGPVLLADRRWERRDSQMRILEGPRLEGVDLAHSRGWSNAERSARDVTAEVLNAGAAEAVALLAADADAAAAGAALIAELGLRAADWGEVRRRALAWCANPDGGPDLGVCAVLAIAGAEAPPSWLLDAGLALGAFGSRTILVAAAAEPHAALAGFEVLSFGDGAAVSRRLRRLGAAVRA